MGNLFFWSKQKEIGLHRYKYIARYKRTHIAAVIATRKVEPLNAAANRPSPLPPPREMRNKEHCSPFARPYLVPTRKTKSVGKVGERDMQWRSVKEQDSKKSGSPYRLYFFPLIQQRFFILYFRVCRPCLDLIPMSLELFDLAF